MGTGSDKRLNTLNSEDSRKTILEALKTGRSSQDRLVHIKGYKVLSNTIPIFEEDKVIGAPVRLLLFMIWGFKGYCGKAVKHPGIKNLSYIVQKYEQIFL